ncbi:MAG: outer membrane beta-barrel protein [Bythopirellula sp.]|nr:outer membrane beta-barrel protein [Bythopirellula sp.]
MKITKWVVGFAALLNGSQAFAENNEMTWTNDYSLRTVACDDSCDPGCGCGDPCDCGSAVGGAGLLSGIGGGCLENFTLAGLVGCESPWEIGGWSNVAYYDNNIPLSQARNDLLSFDDIPNEANLAQQWLYLGRTVDGSNGLDIGGRVDVIYGTDAQKTQAFGNPGAGVRNFGFYDASLDHGIYGWAIPQAYLEVAAGDFSTKVGHFFTPIGYEVIPATGNFFHSHSYTMFNSEPFTHTGFLTTYSGMENTTLYGGWTAGWDSGFDSLNSGSNFLGGFAYTITEGLTFTYLNTYGNFGWRDGGGDDSYSHSCVLIADLTDKLQYIAQSDALRTNNPGVSTFDTIGLNQYLLYWMNDWLGLGGRVEWWKADGVSFYEATTGVNVKLLDNLVFRPEYRQDWAPGIGLDEDTWAIDAILSY